MLGTHGLWRVRRFRAFTVVLDAARTGLVLRAQSQCSQGFALCCAGRFKAFKREVKLTLMELALKGLKGLSHQ